MDKEAKAQAPTPSINAPTSTTAALAEDVEKLQDTMQMPLTLTIAYIGFLYWWAETPADQWIATQETKADALGEPVFDPLNIWWGPPIFFTGFYLATIFLGTRYMEDKPPMKLKSAMLAYNLYQVVLNIWCVWRFVQIAIPKPFWNTPIDRSEKGFDVAFLIWIHYNNKYLELFDTFFMVFRKKNKQVSFLHVYHHVLLIWSWFAVVKYFPGGEAYFGACCNSFIHVCMYGYYLGASLGIPCPWKKYLTMLQLGQFVVCFTHACMCWVRGLVPGWLCALQLWVMSNMLVLFTNFYMKQYSAKKAAKSA